MAQKRINKELKGRMRGPNMLINNYFQFLSISDSGYPNRQHAPNFELPVQKIACHIFFFTKNHRLHLTYTVKNIFSCNNRDDLDRIFRYTLYVNGYGSVTMQKC